MQGRHGSPRRRRVRRGASRAPEFRIGSRIGFKTTASRLLVRWRVVQSRPTSRLGFPMRRRRDLPRHLRETRLTATRVDRGAGAGLSEVALARRTCVYTGVPPCARSVTFGQRLELNRGKSTRPCIRPTSDDGSRRATWARSAPQSFGSRGLDELEPLPARSVPTPRMLVPWSSSSSAMRSPSPETIAESTPTVP